VGNGRDEAERGVAEATRQGKERENDPLVSSPMLAGLGAPLYNNAQASPVQYWKRRGEE